MSTPNGKEWKWLERDPRSSMKQLSIKGRRIRALTLFSLTQGDDALTAEEVAATYHLPSEAVREAIEYCLGDPAEIRDDLADGDQLHAGQPPVSQLRRVSRKTTTAGSAPMNLYLDDDSAANVIIADQFIILNDYR